jgi:hypothetical protein
MVINIHAGICQGLALIFRRLNVGISQPEVNHILALVFHTG